MGLFSDYTTHLYPLRAKGVLGVAVGTDVAGVWTRKVVCPCMCVWSTPSPASRWQAMVKGQGSLSPRHYPVQTSRF